MNRISIMVKSLNHGATAHTMPTELDNQKLFGRGVALMKSKASYISQTFLFFLPYLTWRGGGGGGMIPLNVFDHCAETL